MVRRQMDGQYLKKLSCSRFVLMLVLHPLKVKDAVDESEIISFGSVCAMFSELEN